MKHKEILCYLSLIASAIVLIGCSAGDALQSNAAAAQSSGDLGRPALVFADSGAVPVTAKSSSADLYIVNNSESAINDISYSMSNNLGQDLQVINTASCNTLAAHSGCMLHYRLPQLSTTTNIGSAVLNASYTTTTSHTSSRLLNFEYIDSSRLSESGWQLSAPNVQLSNGYGMVYYYAGNTATRVDSVAGSGISVINNSLPQELAPGEVGSMAVYNATNKSRQLTVEGSNVKQQLMLQAATLAPAQLVAGVVPLLDASSGSATGSLPLANIGNDRITITQITASNSDVQINNMGSRSCQTGTSYDSSTSCSVDFTVQSAAPGTANITISYTDNANPKAAAQTVVGQIAWYNQKPYALLSISNDFTDHYLKTSESKVTLTLSNLGDEPQNYQTIAFTNKNVDISDISDSCKGSIAAGESGCNISFTMTKSPISFGDQGFSGILVTSTNSTPLAMGLAKYTVPPPFDTGHFAYVAGDKTNNVYRCLIYSDGELKSCISVGSGFSRPEGIAFYRADNESGIIYVANYKSNQVSSCHIDKESGTLYNCHNNLDYNNADTVAVYNQRLYSSSFYNGLYQYFYRADIRVDGGLGAVNHQRFSIHYEGWGLAFYKGYAYLAGSDFAIGTSHVYMYDVSPTTGTFSNEKKIDDGIDKASSVFINESSGYIYFGQNEKKPIKCSISQSDGTLFGCATTGDNSLHYSYGIAIYNGYAYIGAWDKGSMSKCTVHMDGSLTDCFETAAGVKPSYGVAFY